MMSVKKVVYFVLLSTIIFAGSISAETNEATQAAATGLFIDLYSDDLSKVGRAFTVGTKTRKEHNVPVIISISLEASRFADKGMPFASGGATMRGSTIHEMMTRFMEAGGEIIICPVCMSENGVVEEDLLDGIKLAESCGVSRLMEGGNIRTLSY